MLRTPAVLGLSMAPRRNRRLFVTFIYGIMLTITVAILVVPAWGDRVNIVWGSAAMSFYLVCWLAFRGLVDEQTALPPPERRWGRMISLGLAARRRDLDELDEREVAIRNAAHFRAYRVLTWYMIIIWTATWFSFDLSASGGVRGLQLFIMPLWGMVGTLPQAALLWTEPDVPEEARV